jgi:hypothetical protein
MHSQADKSLTFVGFIDAKLCLNPLWIQHDINSVGLACFKYDTIFLYESTVNQSIYRSFCLPVEDPFAFDKEIAYYDSPHPDIAGLIPAPLCIS